MHTAALGAGKTIESFDFAFNPTTTIGYYVSEPGRVRLTVVDLLGKEVATLMDEDKPAGLYVARFDTGTFLSGVYFVKFRARGEMRVSRMLLTK